MFNFPLAQVLVASLIAGILGLTSFIIAPDSDIEADMRLLPTAGVLKVDETIQVSVVVSAGVPVNVFKGLVRFNPNTLSVSKIDYNTSIADLWAEEPWYSNGDGTINFIGGTTRPGGFTGEGSLVTITFKATALGESRISMDEARILKHDGLGSEATLGQPIDAIFAVEESALTDNTVLATTVSGPLVSVVPETPDTDLNDDGKQSMVDVSIFMTDLVSQNSRSDFNADGTINLKDLSILNR